MKKLNVQIWFLIGFVATILLTNTILNHQIIKKNQSIYSDKNTINLILSHLVDLNYLTIEIDYLQDYVSQNNDSILQKIFLLKKQEFIHIEEIGKLLRNRGLNTLNFNESLIILQKN